MAGKLQRQVEYYFSDHSFPFDEFLKGVVTMEGKDGWVDISVITGATSNCKSAAHKFPRERATNDDKHKSQSSDLASISSWPPLRRTLYFPKHRCDARACPTPCCHAKGALTF